MARKRYSAEEIVMKLRQVDVLTSQGRSFAEAVRSIGVTEVTYYRWRSEYGGLKGDQVERLRSLRSFRPIKPVRRIGNVTTATAFAGFMIIDPVRSIRSSAFVAYAYPGSAVVLRKVGKIEH